MYTKLGSIPSPFLSGGFLGKLPISLKIEIILLRNGESVKII
jgi:hypothetical protein